MVISTDIQDYLFNSIHLWIISLKKSRLVNVHILWGLQEQSTWWVIGHHPYLHLLVLSRQNLTPVFNAKEQNYEYAFSFIFMCPLLVYYMAHLDAGLFTMATSLTGNFIHSYILLINNFVHLCFTDHVGLP